VQGVPHFPQLATSWFVLVSHPSVVSLLQFPKPGLQLPMMHTPLLHVAVALANAQTWPQLPQLLTSVLRLVSQVVAVLLSHSAAGFVHDETPQVPAAQVAEYSVVSAQTLPHVPQFLTLLVKSVSQPFETSLSQSPKLASQRIVH
jgi:hypothetical protein